MVYPVSHPPQNRMREPFRPLPSAFDFDTRRLSYVEAFARSTTPKVLSNEVTVTNSAAPFQTGVPTLTEVLSVSLAIPMPLTLVLGAWLPGGDRFRQAARLPAELRTLTTLELSGVFVVEWGLGEARNYTIVDMAPGSLQIPVTQSLKVSVQWSASSEAIPPGAIALQACAQCYPGAIHAAPEARYTGVLLVAGGVASDSKAFTIPPYARSFEAGVFTQSSPVPLTTQLDIEMVSLLGNVLGDWRLVPPDPAVPTPPALPDILQDRMIPGGALNAVLSLSTAPENRSNGYVSFRVIL